MHILILAPGFPTSNQQNGSFYGGSFILPEALAYHSAGARVTVLTPHVPGLPPTELFGPRLRVVRFRYFFPARWQKVRLERRPLYTRELLLWRIFQLPIFLIMFFFSIARFIRKVDIIHANWTPVSLLALPYKVLFKVPVVVTYRGTDIESVPKSLNQFIFYHVSAILDPWGDTGFGSSVRGRFHGHFIRLPLITRSPTNTVAQEKKLWDEKEVFHFVFIGRLVLSQEIPKGGDILIPASKMLSRRFSNFKVHILGDGPDKKFLEIQCKKLHMESHIEFHGYQMDVFPYIVGSDAVIGGVGLNAVSEESAFCSALLIVPDIPQFNGSIWVHKENALLHKPRDPASLAEAMSYVIENPCECQRIARNGHLTIKKYVVGIEEGGRIYLQAFQKIINERA